MGKGEEVVGGLACYRSLKSLAGSAEQQDTVAGRCAAPGLL
jgi:hypothetical protein